jgi:hypothetical protein
MPCVTELGHLVRTYNHGSMSPNWKKTTAGDVNPGDRIRHSNGTEMTVSRVEINFFDIPEMIAFIEDTPERWLKAPAPRAAEIEVLVEG